MWNNRLKQILSILAQERAKEQYEYAKEMHPGTHIGQRTGIEAASICLNSLKIMSELQQHPD